MGGQGIDLGDAVGDEGFHCTTDVIGPPAQADVQTVLERVL